MTVTKEESLGAALKQARVFKKLALRAVEDMTGISNAYLSQLENDKIKKPSADILHKLATTYNLDFNYLLQRKMYHLVNLFFPKTTFQKKKKTS